MQSCGEKRHGHNVFVDLPKINKNVPIPDRVGNGGKWQLVVKKMQIGDSVLVDGNKESNALYIAAKNIGRKTLQRKEGVGIRVWRVK